MSELLQPHCFQLSSLISITRQIPRSQNRELLKEGEDSRPFNCLVEAEARLGYQGKICVKVRTEEGLKMAQQLRAPTALPEDPGWVPNTHMATKNHHL